MNQQSNKQTPLKTSTVLRYATRVGKYPDMAAEKMCFNLRRQSGSDEAAMMLFGRLFHLEPAETNDVQMEADKGAQVFVRSWRATIRLRSFDVTQ